MKKQSEYIKFFLLSLALFEVGVCIGACVRVGIAVLRNQPWHWELTTAIDGQSLPKQAFFFLILAPILEELIFRKLLLQSLLFLGKWPAVLISSLLFAVAHWDVVQSCGAFLLGVSLGVLYCKTGRVRDTMWVHFGVNGINGVVLPIMVFALKM